MLLTIICNQVKKRSYNGETATFWNCLNYKRMSQFESQEEKPNTVPQVCYQ